MRILILFFAITLLISCKADSDLFVSPTSFTHTEEASGLKVQITVPTADEDQKLGKAINRSLSEEIIYLLSFNDEVDATNIEEAITSFSDGFKELKARFPDETPNWEAIVNGQTTFDGEKVLSIKLETYLFTGGAHGYEESIFLNFDKKKGQEISPEDLFKNPKKFAEFAESRFRAKNKIPEGTSINSTGFMFEGDTFYLPENIGFTPHGLELVYNPYEVASYADGPIVLQLSFKEVQDFLARKYRT